MVITDVNQITYNGDGVTTAWPFTFPIIDYTDLRLTLINAAGARTDITSDYYVDMVNNTVYYPGYAPGAEPPEANQPPKVQSGEKLEIYRRVPVNQLADLGEKWPFNVIEKGLDKLTMICQDIYSWIGRNIVGLTEDGTSWDARNLPISNVGGPVNIEDAATKDYVDRILSGIIASGDGRVVPFDNVAQLIDADVVAGQIAFTLGYHDIGDGGAGVYNIRAKTPYDVDDGGSIIVLDNSNVAELITDGVVNIKQFGAYGDGTHDDTDAIQNALDSLQDGGTVFIPKSGGASTKPSYYVTDTLTVSSNDITMYAPPKTEYDEGFISDKNITILKVTGFGFSIRDIVFRGNGTVDTFATTNGIDFDRSSLGDDQIYSNIDCEVRNCSFFFLNDAIKIKGNSGILTDNIFVICKRGIVGTSYTYVSGGETLDTGFRGWNLDRNKFHSMSNAFSNVATPVPASYLELDSWCIEFPETITVNIGNIGIYSNNSINNNRADSCFGGFYKGFLGGVRITNNQIWQLVGPFVYNNIALADDFAFLHGYIATNTVSFGFRPSTDRLGSLARYSIYAYSLNNVKILNNFFYNNGINFIYSHNAVGVHISGNAFYRGNREYETDNVKRPALDFFALGNSLIADNELQTMSATIYHNYFVLAENNASLNIEIRNNFIRGSDKVISVPSADILTTSVNDGLPWKMPTAYNNYTVIYGQGIRKLFNGFVEVDLAFSVGDNSAAAIQLPVGYKPKALTIISQVGNKPNARAVCEPNGNVVIYYDGNNPPAEIYLHFTIECA